MQIDRDKIIQAAQGFIQKKRYDRALAEYQKIIEHDPDDVRTLLKVGDLQAKTEAWREAVGTYEKVGRYYASHKSPLKAVAVFKQILEIVHRHLPSLADQYDEIHLRLAELYVQLGLVSDALSGYDQVATKLQRSGRDAEAIEVFRKIVELDRTNPLPHLRLAEAYSRAKNVEGATQHFATAAEILVRLGRRDEALKVFERLLHHNRTETRFARQAAELYLERGAPNDGMLALAKLQICFQADPKDLDTLVLLARAFVAIGQPAKAIEVDKELARLAKEQNKLRIFRETVARLEQTAPNDEVVKKLIASAAALAGTGAAQDAADGAAEARPSGSKLASPSVAVASSAAPPRAISAAPSGGPISSPAASRPPASTAMAGTAAAGTAAGSTAAAGTELSEPPMALTDSELEELSYEDIEAEQAPPPAEPLLLSKPVGRSRPAGPTDDGAPKSADAGGPASAFQAARPANEAPEVEIRESLLDPAEVGAAAGDVSQDPRRILTEAEAFERLGLVDRAVQRLVSGIELAPRSIALRAKLRDLLLAAGDATNAAEQMIAVAVLAYEADDLASAIEQLYGALQLVPGHETAAQLLTNLGYDPSAGINQEPAPFSAPAEPHSSLPSYDIEEVGVTDAISRPALSIGDPFGLSQGGEGAPLPSFPMEDDDAAAPAPAPAPAAASPPQAAYAGRASGAETIEDALEEADFFLSRGLYDDARAIIQDQLGRAPNHPLLIERAREIDAAKAAQLESGTRARPGRHSSSAPGTRAADIAASLDALEALDAGPQSHGADADVDVEEVFTKFKAGVRADIEETDSATHYDLGLAYREMGLVRDALQEFQIAARDPKRACICLSMIGMIHRSQGDDAAAVEAFTAGLRAEQKTPEQELALFYELGDVYAASGDAAEALSYFKKVSRRNPNYSDPRGNVSARLEALTQSQKRPARKQAVHAESDDFDQAFDALIEQRK